MIKKVNLPKILMILKFSVHKTKGKNMFVASSNLNEIINKIMNEPIVLLGFAGQTCFFLRFVIQWIISEKKRKSVVPTIFWYISLVGAVTVFIYGWIVAEPILVVGQLVSSLVYVRNLTLIYAFKTDRLVDSPGHLEFEDKSVLCKTRSIIEISKEISRLESNGQNDAAKTLRWVLLEQSEAS